MSISKCSNCNKLNKSNAKFCSRCGSALDENINPKNPSGMYQSKREKILNSSTRNTKLNYMKLLPVVPFVIFGVFIYAFTRQPDTNKVLNSQPIINTTQDFMMNATNMTEITPTVRDGKIIIPKNLVVEKKLVRFEYTHGIKQIPLLAYISPKGRIITAISMCEPCKSETFHIESDNMVCNSCGTRWELDNLQGISGACQAYPPDPVPSIVVGNEIQIEEAPVQNWKIRA